jgi:trans-aconitate 2-methyltransferase
MARDGWSPEAYGRHADARRQPFLDLLALVERTSRPRVLDVGCGTGEFTGELHVALGARETQGLDSSEAMLRHAPAVDGVAFVRGAAPDALPDGPFDVIVSNSALNWVPDHEAVFASLRKRLAPGGQLAVQVPSNPRTAYVECAAQVARSPAFADELGGFVSESPVRSAPFYCALLERLGFTRQRVGTWRYVQHHGGVAGLADFARGGLLSPYRARLEPERFEAFVSAYTEALRARLGDGAVLFPFRRLFLWARLPPL